MKKQPAKKSYFFEKGYLDLKNIIKDSWGRNVDSAQLFIDKAKESDNPIYQVILWIATIAIYIFGTLFFSIISILHIIILGIFFLCIYISFSIIWLIDAGYRAKNKIFTACPNSGCYKKSILPVYHCPKCNAKHDMLYPSEYGILKRECECGEKLPTTFFNGRSKLTASCPSCENVIESNEARPIIIPIVGAPSVGKTHFVFSMVYYIKELFSKKNSYSFEFMNSYNKGVYESGISVLHSGKGLKKTVENNPTAVNFFLTKNKLKSLFFLYDSAGEAFANTGHLSQHKFYNYFHGLFFIIDPFSIPSVYNKYKAELLTDPTIRPSSHPLEDVYAATIINLEKNYGLKTTDKIKKPIAILFSKVDACDLEDSIGETAINKLMSSNKEIKSKDEAINKLSKDFLLDNDMGAFLRKIEWKFPNAHFFSISSKGKDSAGISDATNWILGQIDKSYQKNK